MLCNGSCLLREVITGNTFHSPNIYRTAMNTRMRIQVVRQKLVFSINTVSTKPLTQNRTILSVKSSLKKGLRLTMNRGGGRRGGRGGGRGGRGGGGYQGGRVPRLPRRKVSATLPLLSTLKQSIDAFIVMPILK